MYTVYDQNRDDYLPDGAMMRHMRSLAMETPDGFGRIEHPAGARKAVHALRKALSASREDDRTPTLQRAAEALSFFEAAALAPAPRARRTLPAVGGTARIQRIAAEILLHSGMQPSAERFLSAMRAYGETAPLRMEELALAPEAMRAEALRLFAAACQSAVRMQREREAAARWFAGEGPLRPNSMFLEHAMRLCRESDAQGRRAELDRALEEQEGGAQTVLQRAHEKQARVCMRLENLPGAMRMPSGIDPKRLLALSEAAQLLFDSECYSICDEESQDLLRRCIGEIAHGARVSEEAVVREALALAKAAAPGTLRAEAAWYWTEDEGRNALLRRLGRADVRLRRRTPDKTGRFYLSAVLLSSALLLGALTVCGLPLWALPFAILACWSIAAQGVNALCLRILPPRRLLRLDLKHIPDSLRTLVVIPAMLPGPERARALAEQIEVLAAGESDANLEFCLLGDLPDAAEQEMPGDEETLRAAREAIDAIGRRRGGQVYFLCRKRQWNDLSGRWMGHERKRGALQALNALLLGEHSRFDADGSDCAALSGRFHYVITLDADTRPYPGALRMLLGAIAHPLNRHMGLNVLQPHMALSARGPLSPFVRLIAGTAGVNGYGGAAEVYQDLCAQGGFAGKGIYALAEFDRLAGHSLPDNAILSHDLIEGFLAGSAFAGDIVFLDNFPGSLCSYFKRLHRWTRGDWQLLPYLKGRSALQKYRMLDNLRASLAPLCALVLIWAGLARGNMAILSAGLLIPLCGWLFAPTLDGALRHAALLSLLPSDAFCRTDAALRALYRTYISHRNMLEWVSAADAEAQKGRAPVWPRIVSAFLCAAFSLAGGCAAIGAALALCFLLGAPILEQMERTPEPETLTAQQREFLERLTRDTWKFFAEHTSKIGFPPDNVQFDPPRGAADRTSPTNIGLYMASCAAAKALGLIDSREMRSRLHTSASSLERIETWRGMPYNWIDPNTGEPLRPKYVSSVDSGNLAACLLLCAQAAAGEDAALAARLESLARKMDLGALYDPVRRLFHIGYDAEKGAMSQSYYDLLASESRILSYTAILLRKVPAAHWRALSRACVPAGNGAAPVSWSGTMFEYLMPELFMPAPEHSLLGEGARSCVREQMAARIGGFWGISESGYFAFDSRRNYQYRAFGVRALMCRDEATAKVISPYSSALALSISPREAAENLMRMAKAGFTTPFGLAEAIDFAPERLGSRSCGVVMSAMAHHQGMLLLGCANALSGGAVCSFFCNRPDVQALSPLLEEAPVSRRSLPRRPQPRRSDAARITRPHKGASSRPAKRGLVPPDGHLLCAGGSNLYIGADGSACLHSQGALVNRWRYDPICKGDGFFCHLQTENGSPVSLMDADARFSPGLALFRKSADGLDVQTCVCLSPEDGALIRRITIINRTAAPIRAELRDIALLSLCGDAEAQEHPAFHDLFLESSFHGRRCMRLVRRPRSEEGGILALDYAVSGTEEIESIELFADRPCMLRRGADPSDAQNAFASPCHARAPGAGLSPIQGARILLTVPPRGERCIGLTTLVSRCAKREDLPETDRYLQTESLLRAQRLAEEQARSLMRFWDLPEHVQALYGRAASLCMYARPMRRDTAPAAPGIGKEALWPLGISGEKPLLAAWAEKPGRSAADLLRLHSWLGSMGVDADAVILYEEEPGYSQPIRDDLSAQIAEMRLHGPGGRLIAANTLDARTREAIDRLSCILLRGGQSLEDALGDTAAWLPVPAQGRADLPPAEEPAENYGHFSKDGAEYHIRLAPGESTPQAWSNILAGRSMGALITETGGGFLWLENSREGRLTPFANDHQDAGSALQIRLEGADASPFHLVPRMPDTRAEIIVRQGESEFLLRKGGLCARIVRFTDPRQSVHAALLRISCEDERRHVLRLHANCDWLMGALRTDLRSLRTSVSGDYILACGAAEFFGCIRMAGSRPEGGHLAQDLVIEPDLPKEISVLVCAAPTKEEALRLAAGYDPAEGLARARAEWADLLGRISVLTGDSIADSLIFRWMPYQSVSARLRGRAGLYQPGGAFGFRDQLQDALCLCAIEPQWAREHILLCAAHQFPEGDVQHWWHPERLGVRTRISDDLLFLPYAAANYVRETGDRSILAEPVPYLSGDPVPKGRHDLYFEAGVAERIEPLREHCMHAIRRAASMTGEHGLPLMGGGDWNDGMDRIGAKGRGESVWLAEFLCVTAREFAEICPEHEQELRALSQTMLAAVETHAWDGDRYLRAFRDDGSPVGSARTEGGCKIDAISQSWAVLAGCGAERAKTAMDTLWVHLYDDQLQILRLLDPPFDGNIADTGYIAAYPPGIRENGGQYTHAACWALLAYAALGDRTRAWTLLRALLPANHADTRSKAERYRVEPYSLAADIYACGAGYKGRGGWTWYTGAAGWLLRSFLLGIAGFERRGSAVRMCALLDEGMDELRVVLKYGSSEYTLISARGESQCDWAELIDDGCAHELRFGAR